MIKIIPSIILIVIIVCGCDTTDPKMDDNSDEVTITHNKNAFAFSYGKAFSVINSGNIIPDIIILAHLDEQGNVIGVFFAADSLKKAFNLVKEFSEFDSAKTFFYNLSEVPDSNYQELALPISANQVWAVKTSDSKYGKILILNSKAYEYSPAPGFRAYYLEAKFKWKYQPNGSRYF